MRKQTSYKKLVARKDDDYYFCDYIFHDGDFKGAVGTSLRPVSRAEYEERTSVEAQREHYEDIWREMVHSSGETRSLDAFVEDVIDTDGVESVFDQSYSEYWPQLRALGMTEEDYPLFECVGGGRCFHSADEYTEVYDAKLLAKIQAVETAKVA